jgi:hypothetical protein
MLLADLLPGDTMIPAWEPPETVVCVNKKKGTYTTITAGMDTLDEVSFLDTRHGSMYTDVVILREGKEIYRGQKYDIVRENCANS